MEYNIFGNTQYDYYKDKFPKEMAEIERAVGNKWYPSSVDYNRFLFTHSGDYKPEASNIVKMSPMKYMELSHKNHINLYRGDMDKNLGQYIRNVLRDKDRIEELRWKLKNGVKLDMPFLSYGEDIGQEGRHRAMAAMLNGEKEIPVLIHTRGKYETPSALTRKSNFLKAFRFGSGNVLKALAPLGIGLGIMSSAPAQAFMTLLEGQPVGEGSDHPPIYPIDGKLEGYITNEY